MALFRSCPSAPLRRAVLPCRGRRGCSHPAGVRLMSGPDSSTADRKRPPRAPDPEAAAQQGDRVTIEVKALPGSTTIVVSGELDLVTMPFLAEQLTLVSRNRPGRLVFDLAGTSFMDCGSARLIAAAGQWLPDGQRPVIRRPGPGVRRILQLTGLDAYCEIEGLEPFAHPACRRQRKHVRAVTLAGWLVPNMHALAWAAPRTGGGQANDGLPAPDCGAVRGSGSGRRAGPGSAAGLRAG